MTQDLIPAALAARENAHAPFSNFKVGAAVEDETGRVFTGCNIENATFGLTLCAERIAIVADASKLTPPCGACRQILWEFCGDIEIVLANLSGATETLRLATLFPRPFDASFL
jgi:cytidine deaminase